MFHQSLPIILNIPYIKMMWSSERIRLPKSSSTFGIRTAPLSHSHIFQQIVATKREIWKTFQPSKSSPVMAHVQRVQNVPHSSSKVTLHGEHRFINIQFSINFSLSCTNETLHKCSFKSPNAQIEQQKNGLIIKKKKQQISNLPDATDIQRFGMQRIIELRANIEWMKAARKLLHSLGKYLHRTSFELQPRIAHSYKLPTSGSIIWNECEWVPSP